MLSIGQMAANSGRHAVGYAEKLLTGVTPNQFARLANVQGQVIDSNHPCFILGHLSIYPVRMFEFCGRDGSAYAPSEQNLTLFSQSAKCVDDPEGKIYPPMAEVVKRFTTNYQAAFEMLADVPDVVLQEVSPMERMRERFPTKGGIAMFLCSSHLMMHLGQMSAWRRMVGLGAA